MFFIDKLTDMKAPKEDDNTHKTYAAYLPLDILEKQRD